MWVLKLKLKPKGQFLGTMSVKHKVSMTGYPLSYYKDNKWLYLIIAGLMFGEEKNKKALIRDIKKQPEYVNHEVNEDFAIVIIKQPLTTEPVYNPQIIRPSPAIISSKGYHIWEFASFDRKLLEKILDFIEKHLEGEILKFKQEKVKNISFTKLIPELTKNQKRALEIAITNCYYNYPKKINMESLAKKMGISYSTYQAHLKKAEGKILPEVIKDL